MWQYVFVVCILFHDMPQPQCMEAVSKPTFKSEDVCAVQSHVDQMQVKLTIEEYAEAHGKELLGFKITYDTCVKG